MLGTKVVKNPQPPPKASNNRIKPYIVMQKTAEMCEQHKEEDKKLKEGTPRQPYPRYE